MEITLKLSSETTSPSIQRVLLIELSISWIDENRDHLSFMVFTPRAMKIRPMLPVLNEAKWNSAASLSFLSIFNR